MGAAGGRPPHQPLAGRQVLQGARTGLQRGVFLALAHEVQVGSDGVGMVQPTAALGVGLFLGEGAVVVVVLGMKGRSAGCLGRHRTRARCPPHLGARILPGGLRRRLPRAPPLTVATARKKGGPAMAHGLCPRTESLVVSREVCPGSAPTWRREAALGSRSLRLPALTES